MPYLLSRKKKKETEWKTSTSGDLGYILTVLQLNFESPELQGYEYKIEHTD